MRVLTAKVMDGGRLDVPEGSLQEGDMVTLLVPEADEGFHLTPQERSFLLESIAQADRGDVIDGWQLLAELGD